MRICSDSDRFVVGNGRRKTKYKERIQLIMKLLTKEHKEHIRSIEKDMVKSFSGQYYDLPEKTKNGKMHVCTVFHIFI